MWFVLFLPMVVGIQCPVLPPTATICNIDTFSSFETTSDPTKNACFFSIINGNGGQMMPANASDPSTCYPMTVTPAPSCENTTYYGNHNPGSLSVSWMLTYNDRTAYPNTDPLYNNWLAQTCCNSTECADTILNFRSIPNYFISINNAIEGATTQYIGQQPYVIERESADNTYLALLLVPGNNMFTPFWDGINTIYSDINCSTSDAYAISNAYCTYLGYKRVAYSSITNETAKSFCSFVEVAGDNDFELLGEFLVCTNTEIHPSQCPPPAPPPVKTVTENCNKYIDALIGVAIAMGIVVSVFIATVVFSSKNGTFKLLT